MSLTTNFDTMTATQNFALAKKHELPDTYEKGRVCAHVHETGEPCRTVLSIYNGERFCFCHHRYHRAEIMAEREGLVVFA